MASYAIFVIPQAHRTAAGRLFAMIEGENPLTSQNLSVRLSATGAAPWTHWWGGQPVDAAWLATYQNLATALPTPAGGWPWMDGATVLLTQADAQAAADALYMNVNTGENADVLPAQNKATVLTALGLKEETIEW